MKPRYLMLRTVPAIALMGSLVGSGSLQAANEHGTTSSALGLPPEGDLARVPLGDLVEAPGKSLASGITNPAAGQPEAVEQGRQLFTQMNCAGCHGFDAKGGVGPDLTDTYWRYGGTPAAIYNSIYEGRPKGMPAWGRALPPDSIWLVVAYIQSLGGSFPAEDYKAALQGDRPGELVAPELSFEQSLNGR
ncbi:c-type cytochrome [Rhodopila sp.]|uniref:c-type cytochrome n=1 Tax=Rhodopila sp. TaxID=2480087 RepID=UPI003D13DADE